jgi:hypothetical protein
VFAPTLRVGEYLGLNLVGVVWVDLFWKSEFWAYFRLGFGGGISEFYYFFIYFSAEGLLGLLVL